MAVTRACYCTRAAVKAALDVALTADYDAHVDSALEQAAEDVDGLTHRRFWNALETTKFDWPNFQRACPWKLYFDGAELADVTVTVPVVTSGGNVIPANQIFWGPWNYAPPFTFLELDRSTSAAFGQGSSPQQDIHITGVRGYWARTRYGGTLAANITDATGTQVTVSNSAWSTGAGVGDVITIGTESMLVTDQDWADTGQAQQGSGVSTDSTADNVLTVTSGAALNTGESVLLDTEEMLIYSIRGTAASVIRAVDGTTLETHTAAEVYAPRLLTVQRGFGGTTAATHTSGAAVNVALVPGEVRELALAEALNTVLQKTTGYARTIGEAGAVPVPGGSLPDLRNRVWARYGRKARQRVI